MTTTISLDIPNSPHAEDIKSALTYFVQFSQKNPDSLEEMMLAMRMRETDEESTIPLADFLASV